MSLATTCTYKSSNSIIGIDMLQHTNVYTLSKCSEDMDVPTIPPPSNTSNSLSMILFTENFPHHNYNSRNMFPVRFYHEPIFFYRLLWLWERTCPFPDSAPRMPAIFSVPSTR